MKLVKAILNKECQLIAVTDDDDKVLAAGAFGDEGDAETTCNILYTLLANLGLVKAPVEVSPKSLAKLLEAMGNPHPVYVQKLSDTK